MHRRQFLATLGATAIAGCAGQASSTQEEPTTAPPTDPPKPSPATTEPPTERPTTRDESTPTRGEKLLEEGRGHVEAAVAAFVQDAERDDPTIVDVDAATTEFSRFDVDVAYREAKADLNDAREHLDAGRTETVDALLEVAEFVNELGYAQIQLVNSFERVNDAMRSFYTENYDDLPDDVDAIGRQREAAAEHAASIRQTYDASTFAGFEQISGEQFEVKLAQIDAELGTFEGIESNLDGLTVPMETFEEDVGRYRTRQYEGVAFSSSQFEATAEGFASIEPAESLGPVVEELTCVFDALAEGTTAMQNAVLARQNSNYDAARQYEDDAATRYRSCERLASDVRPVQDLLESF